MQWPVPCTASSYLKAEAVHEKKQFWEFSLPLKKIQIKCAGLTRESWVEIKLKKQQKSLTEQESRKGDGWHFSWWTSVWMDGQSRERKERARMREPLQCVSLSISWTPDGSWADKIHLLGTTRPRRWGGRRVLPPHRSAQTRSVLPAADRSHCLSNNISLNSLLGQGCFSFPYCNQGCENCEALLETRTQTCTHAYLLVLLQTHRRN